MDLSRLRQTWDAFGRVDARWAILNEPGKFGGGWDLDTFFATGRGDVDLVLGRLDDIGVTLPGRRRALDFGCGIGRVTQHLCDEFESVDGVDIAPSMVEEARRLNRHGARCRYLVNDRVDLQVCEPFRYDLVYSRLVLQHMEPGFALGYIREFVRLLVPDGIAMFQVPIGRADDTDDAAIPLPEGAFRAAVSGPTSLSVAAGAPVEVSVTVANASDVPWDWMPSAPLRVGNHWLDEHGRRVVLDDARTNLPRGLRPGGSVELKLVCSTPASPGRYELEFDVVQEGVAWFADRGSSTWRTTVDVGEPRPSAPAQEGAPQMEMHAIAVETVTDAVERSGGSVIDVSDDPCTGDWESRLYCVRKDASRLRRWRRRRQRGVARGREDRAPGPAIRSFLRRPVDAITADLADVLNHASAPGGYAAQRGLYLNPPVWLLYEPGNVKIGGVNERIAEVPYVFRAFADAPAGGCVLDVGGSESTVSVSLASLGYDVTVVDPRPIPLRHPRLRSVQALVEEWDTDTRFDVALCLSSVEHFGIGAYGLAASEGADVRAMRVVHRVTKPHGLLVFTAPFGRAQIDAVQRTYDRRGLERLLEGWDVEDRMFIRRLDATTWDVVDHDPRDGEEGDVVVMLTARKR